MSYDSKIANAWNVIEQHNLNVTNDVNKVNFDKFIENLRVMGGTSDESLKAVSWEDLQDCGLPRIMARRMAYVFRQDSGDVGSSSSAYVSPKKVHSLSNKELVERYNPNDVKSPVSKRLEDLSSGKAFVVFNDDGSVNTEASVKLLEDILNGLPEVDTAFIAGRPFPVHGIGEKLDAYAEENPLYPGRPLRHEETCDQTGRSWSGVESGIRQLLYMAIKQTKELKVETVSDAGDVMDKVMSQGCTLDTLRSRYPKASKLYDELSKIGKLPLLKIKLSGSSKNKYKNPSEAKIW